MTEQERDDTVIVNPEAWYAIWDAQKPQEVECKHCNGTGEDRRSGADCWNCWGDGTILLED